MCGVEKVRRFFESAQPEAITPVGVVRGKPFSIVEPCARDVIHQLATLFVVGGVRPPGVNDPGTGRVPLW